MHNFHQKQSNNLADEMIREQNFDQISIEEFKTPFERGLDKNNRWVVLSSLVPWSRLAEIYGRTLSRGTGRPAKPSRAVIGAVIIKHKLRLPDEEVIPAIQENPYLQYFLGFSGFSHKRPFDPSLFVTIRRRLGQAAFDEMTDALLATVVQAEKKKKPARPATRKNKPPEASFSETTAEPPQFEAKDEKRSGVLHVDASVAPADVKYPTDLDLLNACREHSEKLIDHLWRQAGTPEAVKPRTYRREARKAYLNTAKKRRRKPNELRRAIRKQLNYVKRNLKTINILLDKFPTAQQPLSFQGRRLFWIIQEVYRQQQQMFDERSNQVSDRIVSVSQPHVRPMVRGKAGKDVEFGAKFSLSHADGWAFLDRLSWDAYHEASDLPGQVERYRKRFGHYPEAVVGDGIYGTRANRQWLAERNIRFSGKPVGRPPKKTADNSAQLAADRKRQRKELGSRSRIEGKFGEGKRGYDLGLVKAKRTDTGESWIAAILFVMNLARRLRDFFVPFFSRSEMMLFRLFLMSKNKITSPVCPLL